MKNNHRIISIIFCYPIYIFVIRNIEQLSIIHIGNRNDRCTCLVGIKIFRQFRINECLLYALKR